MSSQKGGAKEQACKHPITVGNWKKNNSGTPRVVCKLGTSLSSSLWHLKSVMDEWNHSTQLGMESVCALRRHENTLPKLATELVTHPNLRPNLIVM